MVLHALGLKRKVGDPSAGAASKTLLNIEHFFEGDGNYRHGYI